MDIPVSGERRLLLVDRDPAFGGLLGSVLGPEYSLLHVGAAGEALGALERDEIDVALLSAPDAAAADNYFQATAHLRPAPPVIAFGRDQNRRAAADLFGRGASDYFAQPLAIAELRFAINRALQRAALTRELAEARRLIGAPAVEGLFGASPPMRQVAEMAHKLSVVDTSVLLTGESGTGKEVAARAIHALGPRSQRAFVGFAACALPESLIEDELFGHQKGAFTGASSGRVGRFEEAQGGTVFLDEIGDLALPLQAKLLRVLQERQLQRVGSNAQIPLDIRLICATNRNLEEMVAAGTFRRDLYFRISVVRVEMPRLRDRGGDIAILAGHFLRQFAAAHRKEIHGMAPAYLAGLLNYPWPGNVRELQNVIERSVVLGNGPNLDAADLPPELAPRSRARDCGLGAGEAAGGSLRGAVSQFKREMVLAALRLNNYNKQRAARELRISRPYLHRLMNQLEIELDGGGPPAAARAEREWVC